jgi:hypothetical protein
MVFDAATGTVLLWTGNLQETWSWKGLSKTWTQAFPASTPPAAGSTIDYDNAQENVVLFGGLIANGGYINQTWTWDAANFTQQFPEDSPSPRYLPAMHYDPTVSAAISKQEG